MKLFKDKQEAIKVGKKATVRHIAGMIWNIKILGSVIEELKSIEQRFYKEGNYGKQTIPRDCRFYLEAMREYLVEGIEK